MKTINFKTQRRALLADNKEQEYKQIIREYGTQSQMMAVAVKLAVLKAYKVPVSLFESQL